MSRPVYVFVLMLGMALILALATTADRNRYAASTDSVSCHKRGQTVGQTVAMSGFDLVGLRPCIAEEVIAPNSQAARPLPTQLSLEFYD